MAIPPLTIALVDDDPLTRLAWERATSELLDLLTFAAPEGFWRAVEADPSLLERLDGLVTDFYFDEPEGSDQGPEFAAALKLRRPDLKVLLSSDAMLVDGLPAAFDGRVDKQPPKPQQILQALRR
jgi:hypothetical protein